MDDPSGAEQTIDGRTARSKLVPIGALALAVVVTAYFVLGMPGMDHGADDETPSAQMDPSMDHTP